MPRVAGSLATGAVRAYDLMEYPLHRRCGPPAAQGYPVADEHATRLSPLGDQHLNVHGRYAFTPLGLPTGGLRPLRGPAAAIDEDDGATSRVAR